MASTIRLRIIFTGRVQGVGFRATANSIAAQHEVAGFVRNEHDGSVHLEAQGEYNAVYAFVNELRTEMARHIQNAAETRIDPVAGEDYFEIRR